MLQAHIASVDVKSSRKRDAGHMYRFYWASSAQQQVCAKIVKKMNIHTSRSHIFKKQAEKPSVQAQGGDQHTSQKTGYHPREVELIDHEQLMDHKQQTTHLKNAQKNSI